MKRRYGKRQTHLSIGKEILVLFREASADLVVVDALGLVALLQLLTHDARFHCTDPVFSDLFLPLGQGSCLLSRVRVRFSTPIEGQGGAVGNNDAPFISSALASRSMVTSGGCVVQVQ